MSEERKQAFIAEQRAQALSTLSGRVEEAFAKYAPLLKLADFYDLLADVLLFVLKEKKNDGRGDRRS